MSSSKMILTYGVSGKELAKVDTLFPKEDGYLLVETDELTDLIAVPAKAVVINPLKLSADDKELMFDFYSQVHAHDNSLDMIFTRSINIPKELEHSPVYILDDIV